MTRKIVTDRYHCETRPHVPFFEQCMFDESVPDSMIDAYMLYHIQEARCPVTGAQFDPATRVSRTVRMDEYNA